MEPVGLRERLLYREVMHVCLTHQPGCECRGCRELYGTIKRAITDLAAEGAMSTNGRHPDAP